MVYFCKIQEVTLGRRNLVLKSKEINQNQPEKAPPKPKPDFDNSYFCLVELGK